MIKLFVLFILFVIYVFIIALKFIFHALAKGIEGLANNITSDKSNDEVLKGKLMAIANVIMAFLSEFSMIIHSKSGKYKIKTKDMEDVTSSMRDYIYVELYLYFLILIVPDFTRKNINRNFIIDEALGFLESGISIGLKKEYLYNIFLSRIGTYSEMEYITQDMPSPLKHVMLQGYHIEKLKWFIEQDYEQYGRTKTLCVPISSDNQAQLKYIHDADAVVVSAISEISAVFHKYFGD